jgi:hypothetical protein
MSSAFTFDRVVNLVHCQRSAGYVVEVEKGHEGSDWSATGMDLIAVSHTKESRRTHFDDTSSDFGTPFHRYHLSSADAHVQFFVL